MLAIGQDGRCRCDVNRIAETSDLSSMSDAIEAILVVTLPASSGSSLVACVCACLISSAALLQLF
jgi:hypothetical protein